MNSATGLIYALYQSKVSTRMGFWGFIGGARVLARLAVWVG
jgi:hypothetical protein